MDNADLRLLALLDLELQFGQSIVGRAMVSGLAEAGPRRALATSPPVPPGNHWVSVGPC